MNPEYLTQGAALLVSLIGGAFVLSYRIQKVAGDVSANLKVIEVKMDQVGEELKAAREARAKLWEEINRIRERLAKVEAENG